MMQCIRSNRANTGSDGSVKIGPVDMHFVYQTTHSQAQYGARHKRWVLKERCPHCERNTGRGHWESFYCSMQEGDNTGRQKRHETREDIGGLQEGEKGAEAGKGREDENE